MAYINKYDNEAVYAADTTRPAGKSSISLIADSGKVHFDGVNVEVARPKPGDAVFVPSACGYNAAVAPAGTPEGKAVFIDGESLDVSKMPSSMESVGVVAAVYGDKVYVLWKTGSATMTYWDGATSSSYTIPTGKISDEELNKALAVSVKDARGNSGLRQACSLDVLAAVLKYDTSAGNVSWNGGTETKQGDSFYTYYEWMKSSTYPSGSKNKTVADATYTEFGDLPSAPTEEGWMRYLAARCAAYPNRYSGNILTMADGKDATKVFTDANTALNAAFFKPHQFAFNHHATWNSFGRFYNVEGLRHGEWFVPGMRIVADVFSKIRYSMNGYNDTSDVFNRTLKKMSGQKLELYRNANECRYCLPFVRSRSQAWTLSHYGYFTGYSMYSYYRSLSVALLKINP